MLAGLNDDRWPPLRFHDLRDARKQARKRTSAVSWFASSMLVRRDGMSVLLKLF
jgi:hypothetical protein